MRLLLHMQGNEATFIQIDELHHHWDQADLRRWREIVTELETTRRELAALRKGAPAGSTLQEDTAEEIDIEWTK